MISLRDYQRDGQNKIRRAFASGYRRVLYQLPTGGGKCWAPGTPMLMADGQIKPVENIVAGDWLMCPVSGPVQVTSTCCGMEQMYRVTPTKGDPYVVNESHILSLRITGLGAGDSVSAPNGERYASGQIVNICIRDYLASSKTFKHVAKGWRSGVAEFSQNSQEANLPIPPYILGVWLGDGTSRRPEICNVDHEVVSAWRAYAASIGHRVQILECHGRVPIYRIIGPSSGQLGRGYHRNEVTNSLREMDLFNNKHIPHSYKTATPNMRLEMLAGIVDTDGYLHHNGYDIALKHKRFAEDICFLARSVGLAAYMTECTKGIKQTGFVGDYYRIFISGEIDKIPCRVGKRKASPRQQKKNVLVTGISVEPVGVGAYHGFELNSKLGLCMLGDFTVVHNTVIFASVAQQASAKGKRVLIVVHRRELLRQTSRALSSLDVPHGMIRAGAPIDQTKAVLVASVQTLVKRMESMVWAPDLIIQDEAHHVVGGNTWGKVIAYYSKAFTLGVSATPARLDGRGLNEMFEHIICGPSTFELTQMGFLSRARCFTAPVEDTVQTDGIKKRGGDWSRDQVAEAASRPRIVGSAVVHYRKLCHQQPAIVFCPTVAHAERMAQVFRDDGYQAASVDGQMDQRERDKRIADLGTGGLHALMSCDLISEGVDVPVVSVAILMRPTQSLVINLQQIGRALRIHPGKDSAIILDHAGNINRHGLPDDDREWTLDGARKRKREEVGKDIAIKQCPECFLMHRVTEDRRCPSCGYEYPVKNRQVEYVDGQLTEVSRSSLAAQNPEAAAKKATKWARLEEIAKASGRTVEDVIRMSPGTAAKCATSISELTVVQQAMGYKPSWVEWRYHAKQAARSKHSRRTAT